MDGRIAIKFFADVLYVKGFMYFSEYEAILDASSPLELDDIVERMLNDGFSPYMQGECSIEHGERKRTRDGAKEGIDIRAAT